MADSHALRPFLARAGAVCPQMRQDGPPTQSGLPGKAVKELSDDSRSPALGINSRSPGQLPCRVIHYSAFIFGSLRRRPPSPVDSMFDSPVDGDAALPRGDCNGNCPKPMQDEYPVPYFLYGDLAEPEHLRRILGLEEPPVLIRAKVARGKVVIPRPHGLTAPSDQVEMLIDGSDQGVVDGWTFTVNKSQEDKLKWYKGDKYHVVRCQMSVSRTKMRKALTFRFCARLEDVNLA